MNVLDTQIKKQYYISYYDSFACDWLGWDYVSEYRQEWIFSDLSDADKCRAKLNEELSFGNVRCGEYYEVREAPVRT